MTQQLLHCSHISTALQQMRGKAVAKGVRVDGLDDTRANTAQLQHFPHALTRQALTSLIKEDRAQLRLTTTRLLQLRTASIEVALQSLTRIRAEGHDTLLIALAEQPDQLRVEVKIGKVEATGF